MRQVLEITLNAVMANLQVRSMAINPPLLHVCRGQTWAFRQSVTKTKAQDSSLHTLGHHTIKMKDGGKNKNFLKTNFYFKDIIQMQ